MLIPTTRSRLVGLRLAFVHAHLRSFVPARLCASFVWPSFVPVRALWGFDGSLRALRPLVCVYIKYTVSTHMTIEKLTFIA